MSADNPSMPSAERFTLAQYIAALIESLGAHYPGALARMRLVVGDLHARITLDDETCDVYFGEEGLVVQPANETAAVDGEGAIDSGAVLSLLDGYLEVAEAILNGRLSVTGKAEHVVKMFTAIEILLDASPRTPALQSLAARFRRERHGTLVSTESHRARQPSGSEAAEQALLQRLGLLPMS
ncbi:MAG: hypothetical protein MOB07_17935 [Acidobacteria bacterium]|nr:hypothetical protein [Acidobacteriota bacterium]